MPLCGCGIVYLLTVQVSLFTQFDFSCHCYPVKLQVSIMSRVSTLPPVKATVLVLHWIRFLFLVKGSGRCCLLCLHYNINCVICQDLLRCFSKISPTISLAFSSLFWWYISIPPVGLVTFNNLILGMYANVNPLVVTILVPLIILFSLSF